MNKRITYLGLAVLVLVGLCVNGWLWGRGKVDWQCNPVIKRGVVVEKEVVGNKWMVMLKAKGSDSYFYGIDHAIYAECEVNEGTFEAIEIGGWVEKGVE